MAFKRHIVAALLSIILGGSAAPSERATPRLLGIGLDDSLSALTEKLAHAPGIQDESRRDYGGGSSEIRFRLKDASFVRVVFTHATDDAYPEFISFDLGETSASAVQNLKQTLGSPNWMKSRGGDIRRIWGGTGTSEAGVVPIVDAVIVVVIIQTTGRIPNVTFARPAWFSSHGDHAKCCSP